MSRSIFSINYVIHTCGNDVREMRRLPFIDDVFTNCDTDPDYEKIVSCADRLSEELVPRWEQHAAENLLYRRMMGLDVPNRVYSRFKDVVLDDRKNVSLASVWNRNVACALFPLSSPVESEKPGMVHVWTDGENDWHVSSHSNWSGRSYELARELARKAVENDDKKVKQALARDWLVTGTVSGNAVNPVVLGNKLHSDTTRTFLLPRENIRDVPAGFDGVYRSADKVSVAWNHISGGGTKSSAVRPWPDDVDELHILVGGNIKVAVASIIHTQCNKIILWHTDNKKYSRQPMECLKTVVRSQPIGIPDDRIESRLLSADNVIDNETVFRDYFKEKTKRSQKPILFNVTSGNRLMTYSVQPIARIFPNIDLIYHEMNMKHHEFAFFNYREFPPYTGRMKASSNLPVNWKFLYSTDRYESCQEFCENFFSTESL